MEFSKGAFAVSLAVLWSAGAGFLLGRHSASPTQFDLSRSIVTAPSAPANARSSAPWALSPRRGLTEPYTDPAPVLVRPGAIRPAEQGPADARTAVLSRADLGVTATSFDASDAHDSGAPRGDLLDELRQAPDGEALVEAIETMTPAVVPADERAAILSELLDHAQSDDERVRGAAIEAVALWGDEHSSHVIEDGLFDEAESVRRAALYAAFSSTIRSGEVRDALAQIMANPKEAWELRMDAYRALSSYAMEGQVYEAFYRFEQQRAARYDKADATG